MKVIFLKNVGGVGRIDDVKEVADGYALNFLIARGLAVQATAETLAAHDKRIRSKSLDQTAKEQQAQQLAKQLAGSVIVIKAKANDAGNLYQQLQSSAIVEAIQRVQAAVLDPKDLSCAAIKRTGEYLVEFKRGAASAHFTVNVEAQ